MEIRIAWWDALIEFLANPFDNRTDTAFCETLGISREAYYKFLRNHRTEVYQAVDKRRKEFTSEIRKEAFKTLASRLKHSDRILITALEMTGDYIPKSEQKHEILTPSEKKAKAKQLLNDILSKETREE